MASLSEVRPPKVRKNVQWQNNKEGRRYEDDRCPFPWKKDELGRKVLWFIYLWGRQFGTDDDFRDRITVGSRGGKWKDCYDMIVRNFPDLPVIYNQRTGKQFNQGLLRSRWAQFWRKNATAEHTWGEEHPKIHKALRHLEEEMIAAFRTRK